MWTYNYAYPDELYHYGILGQKWGVRRYQNADGTLTAAGKSRYADNYSEQQRTRDKKLYGKRAVKRINKRMLNGESIQSARHNEVTYKQTKESAKAIGKTVSKAVLVTFGTLAITNAVAKSALGSAYGADVIADEAVKVGRQLINAAFK